MTYTHKSVAVLRNPRGIKGHKSVVFYPHKSVTFRRRVTPKLCRRADSSASLPNPLSNRSCDPWLAVGEVGVIGAKMRAMQKRDIIKAEKWARINT